MKDKLLLLTLALTLLLVTTIAMSQSLRQKVKNLFLNEQRIVLAKVEGSVTQKSSRQRILKIKDGSSIIIEVYEVGEEQPTLLTQAILPQRYDGYMNLSNSATQLSLADLDKDGLNEIIVPTYDANNQPRMNVFKYDEATKSLENITAKVGQIKIN